MTTPPSKPRRGALANPPNRFESTLTEREVTEPLLDETGEPEVERAVPTQFLPDRSKTVLTRNDSPDVGFEFSVNPYRGCEHGCAYCYARPTHETLAMGAGLDFESKIMVKENAPELLEEALLKPNWRAQPIAFSGVTDCYQPAERRYRLTRRCLEVLLAFRNPAIVITKNVLLLRDLDVLKKMAEKNLIKVNLSVTTLDEKLAKSMEPRTPTPSARLDAIRRLADAGVPVNVLMAPIIPGLTDGEIPQVLKAVKDAGALAAHYVMLRLPLAVKPIFLEWLEREYPLKAGRVKARIQDVRSGEFNDARFETRMVGEGLYAEQIEKTFALFARRFGLDGPVPALDTSRFRQVRGGMVQGELFGST